MNSAVPRKLVIFAPPAALLLAAYLALPYIAALPGARRELLLYVPYLAIASGMALGLAFNRGRVFLALLLQGIFYWSFRAYLQNGTNDYASQVLFLALSLLLPVNITLFCFMRERGITTPLVP